MFQLSNSFVVILYPGISKRLFLFIFLIIESQILCGLSLLNQKVIFLIEYFLQLIDPLTAPSNTRNLQVIVPLALDNEEVDLLVVDASFGNLDVVGQLLVGQVGVGFGEQGVTGRQVGEFGRVFEDTRVTAVLHFLDYLLL